MTNSPQIVFMGTPDFAVPTLQALQETFGISHVVTVPDAVRARGKKILPSAVKKAALEMGITSIFQPESLRSPDFLEQIQSIKPDIICVVAFRILPAAVYESARLGSFNIHGSLLPKYRGAAPIQWAIINGEKESGVTSFLLERKVDTGNIIGIRQLSIPDGSTAGDLHDALMPLSAELAVETCKTLLDGSTTPIPQNDTEATKAPKLFRETASIPWNKSATDVRNFIHGYSPVPTAWTTFTQDGKEQILKIYRAEIAQEAGQTVPNDVGAWTITDTSFEVQCKIGTLRLLEVQLPNKRKVPIRDFCNGWRGEKCGVFIFSD
jgi:methionyl-tRNA formyltransferase